MGYFDPPSSGQVSVVVEFLLEFEYLVSGVGRPLSFRFHTWRKLTRC